MSNNKSDFVQVNGFGDISANDEAKKMFTFFALNILNTHFEKMCNTMVIN